MDYLFLWRAPCLDRNPDDAEPRFSSRTFSERRQDAGRIPVL